MNLRANLLVFLCVGVILAGAAASGQSQETGEIIAPSGATLRETPTRAGRSLGLLPRATKVEILSREGPRETIDRKTDNWYKVRIRGSSEGWVFGGLIAGVASSAPSTALQTSGRPLSGFAFTEGGTELREAPDPQSRVLGKIPPEGKFQILESMNRRNGPAAEYSPWVKVSYDGHQGWMDTENWGVETLEPDLTNLEAFLADCRKAARQGYLPLREKVKLGMTRKALYESVGLPLKLSSYEGGEHLEYEEFSLILAGTGKDAQHDPVHELFLYVKSHDLGFAAFGKILGKPTSEVSDEEEGIYSRSYHLGRFLLSFNSEAKDTRVLSISLCGYPAD